MKIEGFGSGSISQRHGSADLDPDPDPHQNVMDPQHCSQETIPCFARRVPGAEGQVLCRGEWRGTGQGSSPAGGGPL